MKEASIRPVSTSIHGSAPRYSTRRLVGLALSLLVHGLLLWLILVQRPPLKISHSPGSENAIAWILPSEPAAAARPPAEPVPAEPAPPPRPVPLRRTPKKPIVRDDAPPIIRPDIVATEPAPLPAKSEPVPAPAEDMASMLEAARKRRSEARDQIPHPDEATGETEAQRANRIARDNIAMSGSRQGREQSDAGGVFQVRRVGVSSAEFFFRGWRTSAGRTSSQLVNVFSTGDEDIQVAIVNKMIEIIRREKPDEFVWDSHRLGRQFTLSARADQQEKLTQFLLREFFPDYVPSHRRTSAQ